MAPGFNYVLQVSDILVFSLEYLGLSQLKILTILCSQSTTLAGGLEATHDTNKYTNQITHLLMLLNNLHISYILQET